MQEFEENFIPSISISLKDSSDNKTGSWRYFSPKIQTLAAPCHLECPVGNDIPGFIRAIAECRLEDALKILKDENPFPGVCGRVCFRFCQKPCNRKHTDTHIRISALERMAADYGRTKRSLGAEIVSNGLSVAIIGAGPAGLSCAYFLARLGYQVSVFDSQNKAGGSIRTDNKVYDRLPAHVLESEIKAIFELGVDFYPNHAFGGNLNADDLRKFGAVYFALPDETIASLFPALDKSQNNCPIIDEYVVSGTPVFIRTEPAKKRWVATRSIAFGKNTAISIDLHLVHKISKDDKLQSGNYGNFSFKKYIQNGSLDAQDGIAAIERLNLDNLDRLPEAYSENCAQSVQNRDQGDENPGLSFQSGVIEARKCFSCGTCNLCALCYYVCPDLAVTIDNETVGFNYDYCKGCGICVRECPRGAIGKVTM